MELFEFTLFGKTIPVTVWTLFGLLGNICFTSRILVQWVAAEKRHRESSQADSGTARRPVESVPVLFWWLSLAGALIHITYAYGRHELPFILGLSATLIPYVRNLRIHYFPERPPRSGPMLIGVAIALGCIPLIVFYFEETFAENPWFFLGLAGQAILGSRFYYQWVHSEARRQSVLPLTFWYLSLTGSTLLLLYSFLRGDLVFILSFLFTAIPYTRNIMLLRRHKARG